MRARPKRAGLARRKCPFLRDVQTRRLVAGLIGPVTGPSRTVIVNAVNQCVEYPERKPGILRNLGRYSGPERDIVVRLLGVVGRNRIRLEDFV